MLSSIQSVGSGMNLALKENQLIRDLFNLGAPRRDSANSDIKVSKYERVSLDQMLKILKFALIRTA